MRETTGDIWEYANTHRTDAVCVLTNMTVSGNLLIMGAGQAAQAAKMFPALPSVWGEYYINRFAHEGPAVIWTPKEALYSFTQGHNRWAVVSFPTKIHPNEKSTLSLIERSCRELVALVNGSTNIALPRPGCGLGRLRWVDVKPILKEILDDRFVVITNTESS